MELIQDFRSINFNNSNFQLLDNVGKVFRINTTSREPLEWEILDNPIGQIISVTSGEDFVEIEMRGNFTGVRQTTSVRSNNNDIILITQNV
jgi:ribosomal protein S19